MTELHRAQVPWRDLVAMSRWETLRELMLPGAALALALFTAMHAHWAVTALACAATFLASLRLTHGAIHHAIGLRGAANDVVLGLLSLLLGGSLHAMAVTHRHHHRACLAADDVEGAIARRDLWSALLHAPLYPFAVHRAGWRRGSARQRRWIGAELVLCALLHGWVWSSDAGPWQRVWVWFYLANLIAALPGAWMVHRGDRHAAHGAAASTRSPVLARLSLGMFHHAEHHAFAAVPTCHLHELARRLARAGAAPPPLRFGPLPLQPRRQGVASKPLAKIESVTTSTAPMSQPAPCGRATPRWSTASVQSCGAIASSAALSGPGSIVGVAPPLSCRGPSRASELAIRLDVPLH
ncbi:MAG: fatty acid desaturase [Dokdonella sp.]|nr:fatty acid desaturase [Dokdonella sp.]